MMLFSLWASLFFYTFASVAAAARGIINNHEEQERPKD